MRRLRSSAPAGAARGQVGGPAQSHAGATAAPGHEDSRRWCAEAGSGGNGGDRHDCCPAWQWTGGAGPGQQPGSLGTGGPPGDAPGLSEGGGGDPEPYGSAFSEWGAWYGYGGDGYADTFGGIASGLEQRYGPGASSCLNGAPEDPRAVDRELVGRRLSYRERLELGHVYINGRRVEIRDLPDLVSHGGAAAWRRWKRTPSAPAGGSPSI